MRTGVLEAEGNLKTLLPALHRSTARFVAAHTAAPDEQHPFLPQGHCHCHLLLGPRGWAAGAVRRWQQLLLLWLFLDTRKRILIRKGV